MERLIINPNDLRCIFRLGILDLSAGMLQSALDKFLQVVAEDEILSKLTQEGTEKLVKTQSQASIS